MYKRPVQDGSAEELESWSITLPDDGEASHRVRILPTVKPTKAIVTVTENGVQRTAETEIDGKYLVVEIFGNNALITVSERNYTTLIVAAASAAAAAVIIILVIIIRKKNDPKSHDKKVKKVHTKKAHA